MVSQWAGLMRGKLHWDALSSWIDVFSFFFFLTQKRSLVQTFDTSLSGARWPPFLSLSPLLPVTDDTAAARKNWENTFTSGQAHLGPRPLTSPPLPPPPFNLSTLSRIPHMLSWFFYSPHCVSSLRLWWNISLSLCHSFSAFAAHGRKATRQWMRVLTLNSVYSAFAEELNICWFPF